MIPCKNGQQSDLTSPILMKFATSIDHWKCFRKHEISDPCFFSVRKYDSLKNDKMLKTSLVNTYLTFNNFLNIHGRSLVVAVYSRQRYYLHNDIYKVFCIKSSKVKVEHKKTQTIISQKPVFLKFLKKYILLI